MEYATRFSTLFWFQNLFLDPLRNAVCQQSHRLRGLGVSVVTYTTQTQRLCVLIDNMGSTKGKFLRPNTDFQGTVRGKIKYLRVLI